MTSLSRRVQTAATFFGLMEAWRGVKEETPNWSERIREYWLGNDPPLDILKLEKRPPWCATFVQWVTDRACEQLQVTNPLDAIKLEAYVQSYFVYARAHGWVLKDSEDPMPGDLVVFSFGGKRYDHVGIVVRYLGGNKVETVEGNTGDVNQRDGDGVYVKTRRLDLHRAKVIRWMED